MKGKKIEEKKRELRLNLLTFYSLFVHIGRVTVLEYQPMATPPGGG